MQRFITICIFSLFIFNATFTQDEDAIDEILNEKVTVENPVYKPVIAIGSGVFNFYGDVKNNYINPVLGDFGYRFNVNSYLDSKRYYKLNVFFLYGEMSGNQRSLSDSSKNLNFKTDVVNFGINVEYSFDHFFKKKRTIQPFISAGIENINFTPKGDLLNENGIRYNYWSDGTIRDIPEAMKDNRVSTIIRRDFQYETDLRDYENKKYLLGNYSTNAFAIPVDFGLLFTISDRVSCKLASSIHFTFTDYLDNVSYEGTHIQGKKGNDIFTFNYFSLQLDLFSEPKTKIIEKKFVELEFDEIMYGDEDGDFILDAVDQCPGTPYNVAVDTLGCPLDNDEDGVPDYLDKEPNTPPGAWVDADGKTLSEEEYLERLLKRNEAMNREEVKAYFETIGRTYVKKPFAEVPDKFKPLDLDGDKYISFEELLKAIDDYFDYKLDFTVEDIYELNNFFFGQ